jgi:hypothetical protein
VIWNPKGWCTMNTISRISSVQRNMIHLTEVGKSIIIGSLISDGWLQKNKHWNPRWGVKQSLINLPYLMYLHYHLSYMCSKFPYLGKSKMRNKIFYNVTLQTRQCYTLNELFQLFYIVNGDKYIKCINENLFFYMNYIVLAHWIQGDGNKHRRGLVLNTQSFTLKENILLINILILKFDIHPSLQKDRGKYRLYLKFRDLSKIKPYILPFFTHHFLYKIEDIV